MARLTARQQRTTGEPTRRPREGGRRSKANRRNLGGGMSSGKISATGPHQNIRMSRARAMDSWIVAGAALAASIGGLFNDFVYDDIPLIRDNSRVHGFS